MGKRKTRGRQHHDRNQTSSGGFHVRKYMQFEPQPTAIGFTGYSVTLPFAVCGLWTDVCGKESRKKLFDLRENAFHLLPAKGAQRLALDVAKRGDFKRKRAHRFVIWRLEENDSV